MNDTPRSFSLQPEISKRLARMMTEAGLTPCDLPSDPAECRLECDALAADVATIRQQIEAETAGVTDFSVRDHTWMARASRSAQVKLKQIGVFKVWRSKLLDLRAQEKAERDAAQKERNRANNERLRAEAAARRQARQEADKLHIEELFDVEKALDELRRAVEFFDKVETSDPSERTAVGTDHLTWLIKAAREAARFAPDIFARPASASTVDARGRADGMPKDAEET